MSATSPTAVLVLGGAGFVGRHTVAALVAAGLPVAALARSEDSAAILERLGARPVPGDAAAPAAWAGHLASAGAVIDLTQPALPAKLTTGAARAVRDQRLAMNRALLDAIDQLPADRRPLLVNVSGVQDLAPDPEGNRSSRSPLAATARGFSRIGLPVRAAITTSGLDTVHVYLGNLVYGPGKAFAGIVESIKAGKARIIGGGTNRLPLTHAEDAGGAIAHLLTLERARILGQTVVAVPAPTATQLEFYTVTARALGRPVPKKAPAPLAALVAGVVIAQTMTLDAPCHPDLLLATGYRFSHPTIATGIPAAIAARPETSDRRHS